MEAFPIVVGVVSLLSSITNLSMRLNGFRKNYTEAVSEIDALNRELSDLSSILKRLHEARTSALPTNLVKDLNGVLENCDCTVGGVTEFLQKASVRRFRGVYWAFSGKKDCMQFCRAVEAHKSTINITLALASLNANLQVQGGIDHILSGHHQVQGGIDHIISEIHRIRLTVPGQGQDENYILRRFLEEAETYAGSVYEASTVVGEADEDAFSVSSHGRRLPRRDRVADGIDELPIDDRQASPGNRYRRHHERRIQEANQQAAARQTAENTKNMLEHGVQELRIDDREASTDGISKNERYREKRIQKSKQKEKQHNISSSQRHREKRIREPKQKEQQHGVPAAPHQGPTVPQIPGKSLQTAQEPQELSHPPALLSDWRNPIPYKFDAFDSISRIWISAISPDGRYLATFSSAPEDKVDYQEYFEAIFLFDLSTATLVHPRDGPSTVQPTRRKRCILRLQEKFADILFNFVFNMSIANGYICLVIGDFGLQHGGYLVLLPLYDFPERLHDQLAKVRIDGACGSTAFSHDGELFAYAHKARQMPLRLQVYHVSNLKKLCDVLIPETVSWAEGSSNRNVAFNDDKTAIAIYSDTRDLIVVDPRTGVTLAGYRTDVKNTYPRFRAFSSDLSTAIQVNGSDIFAHNLEISGSSRLITSTPEDSKSRVKFLPGSKLILVFCAKYGSLSIYDTRSSDYETWTDPLGIQPAELYGDGHACIVKVSADGRTVALFCKAGVWLWTLQKWE